MRVLEAFKECADTTNQGILYASLSGLPAKLKQQYYNMGLIYTSPYTWSSPYTWLAVIYRFCQYAYNSESLCQLLLKVSENNFDVNQQDDDGLAVFYTILLAEALKDMHCLENAFETLCRLGADVNVKDNKGRNALDIALTACPYLGKYTKSSERLSVFKLILSQNPGSSRNLKTIANAVERDCTNSLLQFVDDKSTRVLIVRDDKSIVQAETARDKYLALSFVAILLELGFTVKQREIKLLYKLQELPDALRRYLLETLSNPLSLKARCRNVIREAYPGPKLWRLLNVIKIPRLIVDIILFRPYLHHTKITDMNNVELPCR